MSKEIVIDVSYNQVRVGLLEDNDLVEIYIDNKGCQRKVGNIYQGKIENILPGMQAAFINIGLDKNAFLYKGDINIDKSLLELEDADDCVAEKLKEISISDVIKQGQHITVQVIKDAIGTKGPRVTTHITLPGRYLVLMPTVNYVGVSRRIDDENERARLRGIIEDIKPENMGIIVRTAAEGKDDKRLREDLDCLLKVWKKINKRAGTGKVPKLIYKEESLIYRIIRDLFTDDIDKLIINDEKECKKILEIMDVIGPALKDKVFHYQRDIDIFDYYQIESKIEKALNKKVWLKCGGYIVIDQTEALTSIDVNTGKFVGTVNLEDTVLKANMEAAEEIAKQLRLRNIGGIIIIDFIDMDSDQDKERVIDYLRQALKKDKTKTSVLGFTALGLVEMTRKKVSPRLSSILQKTCPYCNGLGKVLDENTMIAKVFKEIERELNHTKGQAVWVQLHPSIASLFKEDCYQKLIEDLERKHDRKIYIINSSDTHAEEINIKAGDIMV
ncbi:MAG: Rne/Rng family ribonuclease [Mahellales bacterium]|jgi:ribonuclease G